MITVNFYSMQSGPLTPVRSLTWDGQRFHLNPADPGKLDKLLRTKVQDPSTGRLVTAQTDPARFMECLQYTYDSAYYWAGEPVSGYQPA